MAIRAVLEICQAYNKTKNFNAFGFGAQVPPAYTVSHLFPLNLSTPEVYGIEGELLFVKKQILFVTTCKKMPNTDWNP